LFRQCGGTGRKFRIEYQVSHQTFNETRFVFQSEEGFFVPCHFLVPKNAAVSLPLVICVQGHNTGMHISMGRSKYPQDEETIKSSLAALLIGRTVIGERVWDLQRVLDVTLKNFPEADKNKIICMGNSGEGTTTFFP